MGYTVNTADGQMTYGSLEQLREAYRLRLINPEDLVRDEQTGRVAMARAVLAGTLPATRTAERPKDEQLGHPGWTWAAVAAGALVLGYLELRRLTVWFPALLDVPGVIAALPRPLAAGALPWLDVFPGWRQVPQWIGPAHVAAVALALFTTARGFWAAPLVSAGALAGAAAYFGATGRVGLAVLLGLAAVGPLGHHLARVLRRWRKRRRANGPGGVVPGAVPGPAARGVRRGEVPAEVSAVGRRSTVG